MKYFKQRLVEAIFSILMRFIDCEEYDGLSWDIKINIEAKAFEKVENFINKLIK